MIKEQFISYVLKNKDTAIITNNNITAKYFSGLEKEWNFIENHINKYGSVPDTTTFLSQFPDFDFIDISEDADYLLDTLTTNYKNEQIILSYNSVGNIFKQSDLDISKKAELASLEIKKTYDRLAENTAITPIDLLRDTSRFDAYKERIGNFDKYYIRTGLPELDAIIGGWDRQDELATIVARTNVGKSWLALKFAVAAVEQGLNVGIYSGEMSERKVGYRIDTLIQHLPNGALVHGNSFVENDYRTYIESLPERFSGSLKVITPKMLGGPAGVSALKAFIEKEHLDILFIDQHSLLKDDRNAKNPVEKAANISMDLKNLQVMERIPIVAVSQQNRTAVESGVDTTQIAQSDRIGQDSTLILFLEKDKSSDKEKDPLMILTLVKSRDTENGKKLSYRIDFNTGRFTYIPDGTEAGMPTDNARYATIEDDEEVFD